MNQISRLKDRDIYLMPANMHAAYVYHLLKRNGVNNIKGIFDNVPYKEGMSYDGVPISRPYAPHTPKTATAICVMLEYEEIMRKQLSALGFEDILILPDITDMDDPRDAANDIIQEQILPIVHNDKNKLTMIQNTLNSNLSCNRTKNLVKIDDVALNVTTYCTLRCKHCSNILPYYKNRRHLPEDIVKRSLDALFSNIDYCGTLSIAGGEALTYPYLIEIIYHTEKYRDKIGTFALITNGTLVPNNAVMDALRKNNITLYISKYPIKESKADEVYERTNAAGVNCISLTYDSWFDVCRIIPPDANQEDVQNRFKNCKSRVQSIFDGKLWYCPFMAHAHHMSIIKPDENNYVDLLSDEPSLREKIRQYIEQINYIPGCIRCSGYYGIYGKWIPAAEQSSEPLIYEEWRSFE